MCGILGTTFKTDNMEKALMTIRHRGPNGIRIEEFPQGKLGFVRLSIRDLSEAAMQPMSNIDRNVWLLFNGEIYREKELRKKLIEKGYKFRTTSDTEVILNAYLEYDEKFIEYIDGMFAIAVFDLRKMKIFLYRDRVGIKPLMYYYDGEGISFASEIKAILELHKGKKFERDNSAIYDYFTYRYIPEPKTLYKNIYKVEPATRIEYDINTKVIQKSKYWKLKVNTHFEQQHNEEEICERLRRLISESVESQLVSDVPVGTFLSGGIDSSVVSAEIFRKNKNVHAFSMGFEIQNPREGNYDETEYAQRLADLYHFPITYGHFDKNQLKQLISSVAEWFDEPFADTSCYPTYAISNIAKKNEVPVILTGDGGDELFGGYTRYYDFNKTLNNRRNWTILSDLYTKVLKKYLPKEEWKEEFLDAISLYASKTYALGRTEKNEYIQKLGIGIGYDDFWYFRKYDHPELPPITRCQYIDFKTYLPADILTKVDRVSMQNSIETRVPLLDTRVVEFAFALSQQDRCQEGELKGIVKRAYEGIIPHSILYKEKKGFSFPGSYWKTEEKDRWIIWKENFEISGETSR